MFCSGPQSELPRFRVGGRSRTGRVGGFRTFGGRVSRCRTLSTGAGDEHPSPNPENDVALGAAAGGAKSH
ncbi:hypothetical protein Q5P01_010673 [Channa striata]|uniref:Uncharacterized protein n=1 Tax=Channa striata TaxID=64152 RepID=A0AA88MT90_CHASR|nr:hypothetical protein Q5P01_010673 [Channa striata]